MEFAGWLDSAFGKYRIDQEVGYNYSIVVGNGGEGALSTSDRKFNIIYAGTIPIIRTMHLPTVGKMLLTEFESLRFAERKDAVYVEASLVRLGGVVALVPAILIDFISSLGRRVGRAGLSLPAERFIAIDSKSGLAVPIRSRLRIPWNVLEPLQDMGSSGNPAERFTVEEPVRIDVVCSYGFGEDMIAPQSRAVTLQRIAANYIRNLSLLGGNGLRGLARVVEQATCFDMRAGKPVEMLESLTGLMRRSGDPAGATAAD